MKLDSWTKSKHMTTPVYLQHIHNHIHLAGQYTWLHLNRVCSNIHLCLSGTFHHWSLQRENTSKWENLTMIPGRTQFILTLFSNKYSVTIKKTVTLETYLLGTRRQSGWPGLDIYPGSGKVSWDIRSLQSHSESLQTLKSLQDAIKRKINTNSKTISKLPFYLKC